MRQILWFRRDLRIIDNKILEKASNEVLPIFIFDKNILEKLDFDDKRVTFIYDAVLALKKSLQELGLDLYIFFDTPKNVFTKLKNEGFDEVLCSCDFDSYSIKRDKQINEILPLKRYLDSFLINPNKNLKKDGTPYKVFTPFYKSLSWLTSSDKIGEAMINPNLKLSKYENKTPTLDELGFERVTLPEFLKKSPQNRLDDFKEKVKEYEKNRDIFYKDGTSNLGVDLRFGTLSPRMIFNEIKKSDKENSEAFIRQLFWREFYNYILFHFPNSENENWNGIEISWSEDEEDFQKWCEGKTGVPIIDAAMRHFNKTGMMHNRLRMIVSSFLCKNLLIDWKKGEQYFAKKLLDYEASSNIGSWQWAASTGADSVPYFRIFNPYLQSAKFDKEAIFIKSVMPELKDVDAKLIHIEGALKDKYVNSIVDIKYSRDRAMRIFKEAKNAKV
ncbi:Deoxyribodipyrimidine photo-lyase [Arcobacter nitrofigilis DSM 7299]|uniref:Deoxyribodipyrimidine photo-lyase n=1 Tax=Arcobacter nitrofigilis (strain ATCC 33309 / DSM 7299 / CCUG 15893 / LMG 7604 / NCTC 12251 / CI) TaxID=572480 RepID=D5V5K7_ARCNC|nr:deoxyribodipyrimidine photo-lyase [Arcobacter nitrofigilis]ADG92043.1 Deoxyribodipyrimidine photo-lyase [Arcobacter nitrofigilis DSM 7299]